MADDTRNLPEAVDSALEEMKLQEGGSPVEDGDTIMVNGHHEDSSAPRNLQRSHSSSPAIKQSASQSPGRDRSASQTPRIQEEEEKETIGGGIVVTVEPGKAPKLSRKSSQKVISRPPPLYNDIADSTEEASEIFQVIKDCIYGSKHMGSSEHDALDCDCSEQWSNGTNQACGEDSDCINRATKMECVDGDCNCGSGCQNQRFQQKQYANVSVIKTDKKGYGLRANVNINADTFIFEYLGEVINEPTFRRRTQQYNDEGIKHFYFMSLTKHEFVDATKKGNLGRFCNHSCNPNCYVDKWVVGEKLRMGIFAERNIKAGEELVFNYNVDRYGADPQPCYCGEENCTGFIGGKTQTDRATKLPLATIEALGIDDGDGWDSAVTKRSRKKKTGEDDEEYVNNVQPKGLDEEGVRKVMATLMQCKEKWIAVKLLSRIQRCDDDRVRNRVVQMHGYQILRTTLTTWKDDNNVILQILDILYKFPRLTRNKISDSKIEATIETLVDSEHEDVAFEAKRLLEDWNKLEVAYRIPRKKFDPTALPIFERRNTDREEVTKSPATPLVVAPKGPRSNLPQRNLNFASARPPFRRPPLSNVLPSGWFQAQDEKGNTYYYSKSGQTTWQRPNIPAYEPPPPPKAPPKSVQTARAIQDIIDSITKIDPKTPTQSIPTAESTPKEKKPVEKWRALSQEKQMKLYENTLFPHIKHVMQKFTKQLPREDLKKFAKEVGKKLVASDFKNNRVEDPTKISEKQEKKVKSYVRDFFEKAVQKRKAHDKKKAEKASLNGSASRAGAVVNGGSTAEESLLVDDDLDPIVDFSPTALDAPPSSVPATPSISASGSTSDLKRKRDDEDGIEIDTPETGGTGAADESFSDSHKRLKEDEVTPPPPPPPPPVGGIPVDTLAGEDTGDENGIVIVNTVLESEEQLELRLQEEDLMRENEEAMALELAVTELESVKENLNGNGNLNGIGLGINLDADAIMESANEGPGKRSLS